MKRFFVVLSMLFILAGSAWAVDSNRKVKLLEAAVEGDTNSQFELAEIYAEESTEYDMFEPDMKLLKKAVHWYEKAAEKGHNPSQHALLGIYRYPYDEASPPEWPEKWLPLVKRMAAEGDRRARYDLARYYSFPHNCDTRFRECLNQAIGLYSGLLKDLAPGQETVFKLFVIGAEQVTRQDIEKEIARLQAMDPEAEEKQSRMKGLLYSARKSDTPKDLIDLGDSWANPNSPDQSIKMAKKAYEYAAEKNHPKAQVKFAGLLYQHAEDRQDYQNAYFWAMAAVMNGDQTAPELLSKIKQKLPAEHLPAMEAEAKKAFKRLVEYNKKKESGGEW